MNLKKEEQAYDFDKPEYTFIPKGIHNWRQEGIYIICRSCEITHAVFIGPDKMFVGMNEDGKPILINRDEYFEKGYKAFK